MQKFLIVEFGLEKGKTEAVYSLLKIFVFRRPSWSAEIPKISSLPKRKIFLLGDISVVDMSAILQIVS